MLIPPPTYASLRKGTQRLRCSMGRCSRRGSLKAVFRWWYQDAPPSYATLTGVVKCYGFSARITRRALSPDALVTHGQFYDGTNREVGLSEVVESFFHLLLALLCVRSAHAQPWNATVQTAGGVTYLILSGTFPNCVGLSAGPVSITGTNVSVVVSENSGEICDCCL